MHVILKLLFLKGTDKSNWEVLQMNEPTIKKAMTTLEFLSQDREARLRYEERQKFLHDEASAMEWALDKGIEQGIKQGIEKGKQLGLAEGEQKKALEVAKGLLKAGIAVEVIIKTTGLTKEEILALK
jgi:predicted transposase/invertase (TIGR01784 family)